MTREELLQVESSQRQLNEEQYHYWKGVDERILRMSKLAMIMNCNIAKDGDKWCCLYGDNLQVEIAGFGDTPLLAIQAWAEEFGWK